MSKKANEINVFDDLLAITEASILYGTSVSTVKRKIREGAMINGVDCKNYGKQWVIKRSAMDRVFGVPVTNLSILKQDRMFGK